MSPTHWATGAPAALLAFLDKHGTLARESVSWLVTCSLVLLRLRVHGPFARSTDVVAWTEERLAVHMRQLLDAW